MKTEPAMKMSTCVVGVVVFLCCSGIALAADAVNILVPASAGGGWDQTGRALGQAMQSIGVARSVRIDNRGGAGGTIGIAEFVRSSRADAGAMMIGGLVMVGAIELAKSRVTLKHVTPIARLTAEYEVVVVPANSKYKSLKELLDAFRSNPGTIAWGGGSAGGVDHILVGLLARELKMDASRIRYVPHAGGGEALAAILGGHVTAGVSGLGEFANQIREGRLKALAVSSPKRISIAPDVATFKEQGVNVELFNWRGVFGAPGLGMAQRNLLIKQVTDAVKSAAWQESLKQNDWSDVFVTGDAFGNYVDAEVTRVGQVLRDIGLVK